MVFELRYLYTEPHVSSLDLDLCEEIGEEIAVPDEAVRVLPWSEEVNDMCVAMVEYAWEALAGIEEAPWQNRCRCYTTRGRPKTGPRFHVCGPCRSEVEESAADEALRWFANGCKVPFGKDGALVSLLDVWGWPGVEQMYAKALERYQTRPQRAARVNKGRFDEDDSKQRRGTPKLKDANE